MNLTEATSLGGRNRRRRRIGRGKGSGCGKTSGRGHKGGGQRSGWKARGLQEGGQLPLFRRVPKRGFNNAEFTTRYTVVNVGTLEERFPQGAHVTSQVLLESGIVRTLSLPIKVLGTGELKKKLVVEAAKFSASALEKIGKAGGEAKVVAV